MVAQSRQFSTAVATLQLAAALLGAAGDAQNAGLSGCECIEWSGLDNYLDGNGDLVVRPAGPNGVAYTYNPLYGTVYCNTWDATEEPYCADSAGTALQDAPQWCSQSWCYVNSDCSIGLVHRSSYFPEENLHYSYATCGSTNTFNAWWESADRGGSANQLITDLVDLVEGYTRSTRNGIEQQWAAQSLQGLGSGDCSLTSGCACASCQTQTGWGTELVDFFDVMALTNSDVFRCLMNIIKDNYQRVANLEYSDTTRIGYQYAAMQTDGSYMQWPASAWCPANFGSDSSVPGYSSSSYDPRFRDWYAGPASGPKDVVIVLDVSGSMGSNNRLSLAKQAAKQVLKTLTWVDFVTVVSFSSGATAASGKLLPATSQWKDQLNGFIDGLDDGGSTNFIAALNLAFDLFDTSRNNACFSSGCNGALLFLSDGEADDWNDEYTNTFRGRAGDYVTIFTFGLGSGVNMNTLNALAGGGPGFAVHVQDGGDLGDAMSAYYLTYSDLSVNTHIGDRLRWVVFNDLITNTELMAGCMPFFDSRDPRPEVANPNLQERLANSQGMPLLGVTCMDLNMIVDMDRLRSEEEAFSNFSARFRADSRRCTNTRSPPTNLAPDSASCSNVQNQARAPMTGMARAAGPGRGALAAAVAAFAALAVASG